MDSENYRPSAVFIIDPGMSRSFGHNYAYNHAFRKAFAETGAPVVYFFSNAIPEELLREYPGGAVLLSWFQYSEMQQVQITSGEEEFRQSAERLCEELRRCLTPTVDEGALIFAHSLDPISLLGIALWHNALPKGVRPFLALNVMLGVDASLACRIRLEAACSLLRDSPRARVFGGSKACGELLSGLIGRQCPMLPSPLPTQPERYHRNASPDKLVFGLAGDWRNGKNLQILPSVLRRYLAKGGQGTFRMQMTPTDEEVHPVVLALHDLSKAFAEKISLDTRFLDEHAYYSNMASCSALIIPYTAENYSLYRPSGLAIEAAAMAVPVICAQGGFVEEELGPLRNGSLFMSEPSVASFVSSLFQFEKEMTERKALALEAAPGYCRYHDIQGLARRLMEREQG